MTFSHRLFLSNFVKNRGFSASLRSRSPIPAAFIEAERALTSVSIQLRPIDLEDLKQDVMEVFLGVLQRYRSRNQENYLVPYIMKAFPYALHRRIRSLVKDPLVNLASDKILSLEAISEIHTRYADYSPLMHHISVKDVIKHLTRSYEEIEENVQEEALPISWFTGDTCDEAFTTLTASERRILYQFHILEMTDVQISRGLGVSYNTAIRRRHRAESKVRGEYQPPVCRWCAMEIPKAPLGRQPRQCSKCRESRRLERQRVARQKAAQVA